MVSRKESLDAIYKLMVACFAPVTLSTVRLMNSLRQGDKTCSHTSSGTAFGVSTNRRVKLNSVSEAPGNATSISLNPILTRRLKYVHFCSTVMGWARLWLPSRRSVANQRGAFVIFLDGHVRSSKVGGEKDSYFSDDVCSLGLLEHLRAKYVGDNTTHIGMTKVLREVLSR
jgi:hypothetical protein